MRIYVPAGMSKWADQSLPRKVGACSEDLLLWNNGCLRTCVPFIAKPGDTGVGSHSLGTADSKVYEQTGWGSTFRRGHYIDHGGHEHHLSSQATASAREDLSPEEMLR